MVKILSPWLTLVASFLETPHLQTIGMGWWSKFKSAHGLMEGVDGWESYYFIR